MRPQNSSNQSSSRVVCLLPLRWSAGAMSQNGRPLPTSSKRNKLNCRKAQQRAGSHGGRNNSSSSRNSIRNSHSNRQRQHRAFHTPLVRLLGTSTFSLPEQIRGAGAHATFKEAQERAKTTFTAFQLLPRILSSVLRISGRAHGKTSEQHIQQRRAPSSSRRILIIMASTFSSPNQRRTATTTTTITNSFPASAPPSVAAPPFLSFWHHHQNQPPPPGATEAGERKGEHDRRRPHEVAAIEGARPSSSFLITEVNSNDVLFGRGSRSNVHPGNIYFRKLVSDKLKEYTKSTNSRRDKTQISRSIIATIHRHGGRFLREVAVKEAAPSSDVAANNMLVSGHSPSRKGGRQSRGATAYYTIITDESILTRKTRQAFRHFTRCRERERKATAGITKNEPTLKPSAADEDDDDAEAAVEHPSAPPSFLSNEEEERGDRLTQLLEEAVPSPHGQPDSTATTTAHRHHHHHRIPFHPRENIMAEEATRGADAGTTATGATTRPTANTQVWRHSTLPAERNLADTIGGRGGGSGRENSTTTNRNASHSCHQEPGAPPFHRSIIARQPQHITENDRNTSAASRRRDPHRHAAAIAAAALSVRTPPARGSSSVVTGVDGGGCHARPPRDDFVTTQSLAMPLLLQGGWRRQPPNFRQSGVAVEERESIIRAMGGTMQPQPPQPQRQRQRHAHRNRLFAACATRGAAPTLNQLLASSTTRNGGGNGIVKNEDDHGDRSLQQQRQEIDHAGAPPMDEQRNVRAGRGGGGGGPLPWQSSSSSPGAGAQGVVFSILDVLTLMAIQETMMKGGSTRK
mmetsp:Transcript_28129/g.78901  ORF Transcript_28129/g.78901 Transcript_28129/m.78901 type:complete len:802 (-) Transcript_28129:75-2480(-)